MGFITLCSLIYLWKLTSDIEDLSVEKTGIKLSTDDPLRQVSIELVILPQGFALHRADEIVQLLLRFAVDVCDAHKFGTILIDAINNGSNRFHIVERVVVGIIPMLMEPDIGILTDQGSPPSLQFIWTATLVTKC